MPIRRSANLKTMKNLVFPILLTVCSAISIVVYQSPFTYFNLFVSIVLLCILIFSRQKAELSRLKISAMWLLIFELVAFVLLPFGVNFYQPSLVWIMYVGFVVLEIFVTPRMAKKNTEK